MFPAVKQTKIPAVTTYVLTLELAAEMLLLYLWLLRIGINLLVWLNERRYGKKEA